MKELHLQGRLLMSDKDETGVAAILRFTPEEGGKLVASSHEAGVLRKKWRGGEVNYDLVNLIFDATYDLLDEKQTRRRFFLEDCLSLGSGFHSGQVGSSESAVFHPHFIHETNIIWDTNELPKYDSVSFCLSGTEEWISSLSNIDEDIEWGNEHTIDSTRTTIKLNPSEEAAMPGLGTLKISAGYSSFDNIFKIDKNISHSFTVELKHAKSVKELIRIAGYVANLISLGTSHLSTFKSINTNLLKLEKSFCTLYFQPRTFGAESEAKQPSSVRMSSFFHYEDIGRADGVAKWISRAEMSERYGWDEHLMISLLLEGEHNNEYSIEYKMLPVITGALMLNRPKRNNANENNIPQRLKQVLEKADIPNADYLDDEWCEAIACLRNKFIAHPEASLGIPFPGGESLFAKILLYRVCVSVIIREMLTVNKEDADQLVSKIWQHHETKQYLNGAEKNDIKEWYRKHHKTLTEGNLDMFAERQAAVRKAIVPVPLEELSQNLLKKTDSGTSVIIYEYECEECQTRWRATKHRSERYRLEINGRYNSGITGWDTIGSPKNIKDAQKKTRESVSKHFCVPHKKGKKSE